MLNFTTRIEHIGITEIFTMPRFRIVIYLPDFIRKCLNVRNESKLDGFGVEKSRIRLIQLSGSCEAELRRKN